MSTPLPSPRPHSVGTLLTGQSTAFLAFRPALWAGTFLLSLGAPSVVWLIGAAVDAGIAHRLAPASHLPWGEGEVMSHAPVNVDRQGQVTTFEVSPPIPHRVGRNTLSAATFGAPSALLCIIATAGGFGVPAAYVVGPSFFLAYLLAPVAIAWVAPKPPPAAPVSVRLDRKHVSIGDVRLARAGLTTTLDAAQQALTVRNSDGEATIPGALPELLWLSDLLTDP